MISKVFAFLCRFAPLKRALWRNWYQHLAKRYRLPEWQTMNYGFIPIPLTAPMELAAANESERLGLQLYRHVTSEVALAGLDILEVGCGRGGGAAWLFQTSAPASYTAVDFSRSAIALCQQRYTIPGLEFIFGDAERLPLPKEQFDAVINVESSHCYGSMETFLDEVYRVLKPGAYFLYADFRLIGETNEWRQQLTTKFKLLKETQITPNVLAALDADDARKRALMELLIPRSLQKSFSDFAALKNSLVYREFAEGRLEYWSFVLQKS